MHFSIHFILSELYFRVYHLKIILHFFKEYLLSHPTIIPKAFAFCKYMLYYKKLKSLSVKEYLSLKIPTEEAPVSDQSRIQQALDCGMDKL